MIAVGTLVRFAVAIEPGDESARFVVVEDRGDRVAIQFVCDLPIPPVNVVRRSDVVEA